MEAAHTARPTRLEVDDKAQTDQYRARGHWARGGDGGPNNIVASLGPVPTDIRANRFGIRLRDLSAAEMEAAQAALDEVKIDGVPNYFDDQRFGSVAPGGEFVARLMVRGQFEDALRLALTAPYEFDPAEPKRAKAILCQHWGDWAACKANLPRSHARPYASAPANDPAATAALPPVPC